MRIGFCGKGGSGKTTIAGLFTRYAAQQGHQVLAIDSDMNQHLGTALGFDSMAVNNLPKLGANFNKLAAQLRGNRPVIVNEAMVATTPPAQGSVLLSVNAAHQLVQQWALQQHNVFLMATGAFEEKNMGATCYHAYTKGAELVLSHLVDTPNDVVVVDHTAGADPFTSGMFRHFDVMCIVVEPTVKSTEVYHQCQQYAKPYGVPLVAVGNKIIDAADNAYVANAVGQSLIGCFKNSPYVRAQDRGCFQSLDALEPDNLMVLQAIAQCLKATNRDWQHYQNLNHAFHKKTAQGWANACYGADLTQQIDPSFSYPKAVSSC